jgi:hypothetical protein
MRWPDTTTSLTAADWILWDFMNKRLNNGMTFNQLMSMEKVWKSKPIAARDLAYCNKKNPMLVYYQGYFSHLLLKSPNTIGDLCQLCHGKYGLDFENTLIQQ